MDTLEQMYADLRNVILRLTAANDKVLRTSR